MQAQYPQQSTDESKAGDAAHWVCSTVLDALKIAPGMVAEHLIGSFDPAGTCITDEMAEAAQVYIDECLAILGSTANVHLMNVESRVHCRRVHPTHNWGTVDFWAHLGNVVYLRDFKFGHDYVDEYECWQNLDYAAGILDELNVDEENTWLDMGIVQPRYYNAAPVRTWRIKASDLAQYVKVMKYQTMKALNASPGCVSGPHCKNCTARVFCPAARQSSYWAMQVATEAVPVNLPAEPLGLELEYVTRAIKALEATKSGLEEYAELLINKGQVVPGYARQSVAGQRAWLMDNKQVIQIGEACGLDLRSPKPVTPAQAEKLGADKHFVKAQTHRPSSMKLKRVTQNSIKKVFN
jgi:hypothetical protein